MPGQNANRNHISYAWTILTVLVVGHMVSFGIRASFGAYITPWEEEFSVNRTAVTSISMVNFVAFALCQPFAGKLNDLWGRGIIPTLGVFLMGASLLLSSQANQIWQIHLLYGGVCSVGVACCTSSVVAVIVTKWFDKKRGLALGLAMAGMAIGSLILVPVSIFAIERLGWRTTIAASGLIMLVLVGPLYAFLLRSKPEEKGQKPYGYTESEPGVVNGGASIDKPAASLPIFSIFRKKAFWMLSIPYFICGFTDVGVVQTHVIPMLEGRGFLPAETAMAVSAIAFANIAGTIVTGHMSDHFNLKRQLAVIYSFRVVTIILLIVLQQVWLLLVFAVLYGAVEMASIAPTNALTVKLFDGYSTGVVLGVVAVSHQLGGAIGSLVPGMLFDLTGSYSEALIAAAALLLLAAGMSLRIKAG